MKPVSPVIPGAQQPEVVYAKDQPEYIPLPALRTPEGVVLTRWELSDEEMETVLRTRSVYLALLTFNAPLQPIIMGAEPPAEFDHITRGRKA